MLQKAKYRVLWWALKTNYLERSSCGWSTRQGGLSSAPSPSAPRSVCDLEQVTNSLFLFPLWWKWWRWSCLFSAELWALINVHFQAFLILCRKYVANIAVLSLLHHIINSKLTQVYQTNFSPTTLIVTICSIRKQHSYEKPLFKSVKQRTWNAGWEQHLSRLTFLSHSWLAGPAHGCRWDIRLNGSLTKHGFSYVSLHYYFPAAPYYFVLLLVQGIGYGKSHPVQPLTDSELSTCWTQWKDFTHQPQINTSSLFCILGKAMNWEVRNNEELLLAPTSGYPKRAGSQFL